MHRSTFLKLISGASLGAFTLRGQWIFANPLPFVGAPSGLRPYLHLPRPDSIWVSWWSDADSQTFIDFGASPDALNTTVTGSVDVLGSNYHYHSAKLTNLTPNTYYYYRVRTENATSATFRFRSAPALGSTTSPFRALIIGDNQIVEKESTNDPYHRYEKLMERAVTKIRALHQNKPIEEIIDVVVMPGDQVDYGNNNQWRHLHFYCSRLISPNVPIMTSVGNHETYGDSGLNRYRRLFRYEEVDYNGIPGPDGDSYYSHQMANFVFVHTNSELGNSATQTQWIQSITNAAKSDSSVDWLISICHRPYQAEQYLGDISSWMRNTAMPILNQTDKHFLNIGAHHHIYHRGQVKDAPNYHIISGGSAWDQYWGQSGREADYDDVQKSINNWTWQLLVADPATQKAEVTCYAEAHCLLPANNRWIYNSKEVDRFHRIRGKAAPNTPSLTNSDTSPLSLPYTLNSSPYSTSTDELLNSVQYQVSTVPNFSSTNIDTVVDFENFYGDTGAPDYLPVDIHAGKDITQYELGASALPNGTYYARTRHRDRNATWSAWSLPYTFTITGSNAANPSLQIASPVLAPNTDILVQYEQGPGNAKDWIGLYKKGQIPGGPASTAWSYVSGPAGNLTLNTAGKLDVGAEYFLGFFENDAYSELSPRVPFYHGNRTNLSQSKDKYDQGEDVTINFSNADVAGNQLKLYRAGMTPGLDTPIAAYTLTSAQGSWPITALDKGYYFAVVQANSGNIKISDRLAFQLGERIATLTLPKTTYHHSEDILATFLNGPANPKDWLGVYRQGEEPGTGELLNYVYVDGRPAGDVTVVEDLPIGAYYLSLFTNDSYTEVSNRVSFNVEPQVFKLDSFTIQGTQASLLWATQAGVNYTLQKSADLKTWQDLSSYLGDGSQATLQHSLSHSDTRCFFRVVVKTP
ncbi:fibronectin type III domain-containing protein [Rubritalea tangerina]|uniref:Fibronectin type III domain-containing protein n=2 Tax=Rubritalea tangerina TaxID=430798 RepID=A0ABW4ZCI7_9BACT